MNSSPHPIIDEEKYKKWLEEQPFDKSKMPIWCPYCGGNTHIRQSSNSSTGVDYFFIQCRNDHNFTLWSDNIQHTIKEFNKRTA